MNQGSKYLKRILGLVAALGVIPAYALGLGELRVQSALDEPLVAEIQLTSIAPDELESLEVKIGSREVFESAGIELHQFLTEFEFEVIKGDRPVIRVTSQQPIQEPFLHFVVRTQWDYGMFLSEYTALLDPPLYAEQQPDSVSSPVALEAADEPVAISFPTEAEGSQSRQRDVVLRPQDAAPQLSGVQYGPIARGDTLWGIAADLGIGNLDANVFQVMIALLRNNPGAFVDNNINRLKIGEMLRLEDPNVILLITKAEASRAYKAQIEQAEATKAAAAAPAEDAADVVVRDGANEPQVQVEIALDEAAEPVDPEAKETPAATAAEKYSPEVSETEPVEKDVFRIAPATAAAGSGDQSSPADAEVEFEAMKAAIDREIDALNAQVEGLRNEQKIAEVATTAEAELQSVKAGAEAEITILREQIATLKQAAAEREIAALRAQLAALKQDAAASPEAGPGAMTESPQVDFSDLSDQVEGTRATPPGSVTEIQTDGGAATAEALMLAMRAEMAQMRQAQELSDKQNAELQDKVAQLLGMLEGRVESTEMAALTATESDEPTGAETETESPATGITRVKVGQRTDSPNFWVGWQDNLPQDQTTRIAIALGAVFILLMLWIFLRRRRSLRNLEDSLLMGPSSLLNQPKKSRYLSELSLAGMGRMEADEIDPLSEAEVYLGYGRVPQAIQVLKEALARDPNRHELKVKLLEIYQQEGDLKSLDKAVSDLGLTQGEVDPIIWNKIVELRLRRHDDGAKRSPDATWDQASPADTRQTGNEADWELPLREEESNSPPAPDTTESGSRTDAIPELSNSVDPSLSPFPEPERNVLSEEEELDFFETPAAAGKRVDAVATQPAAPSGKSDMLNFATTVTSEPSFDYNLDPDQQDEQDEHAPREADTGIRVQSEQSTADATGDVANDSEQWSDVAMKIQLAEAYLNMGEKREALNILKGIEHVGSAAEKQRISAIIRRAGQA